MELIVRVSTRCSSFAQQTTEAGDDETETVMYFNCEFISPVASIPSLCLTHSWLPSLSLKSSRLAFLCFALLFRRQSCYAAALFEGE